MAPIPVRAPRRADAGTTARGARTAFERGAKIKLKAKKDASVYITSRNIPENDRLLEAYSADETAKNIGHAVPGLLDIATQTYRTQGAAGTANKTYSLADAMRDAVWAQADRGQAQDAHDRAQHLPRGRLGRLQTLHRAREYLLNGKLHLHSSVALPG